jgi:hypothetical protein
MVRTADTGNESIDVLSDLEREALREVWASAMMRRDYFGNLSVGYQRRERIAKQAILVLACGALLTALAGLPGDLAAIPRLLAGISAVVSVWLLVVPSRTRATQCAELRSEWNQLVEECRILWDNMEPESAPADFRRIKAQSIDLSKRVIPAMAQPDAAPVSPVCPE